MKKNIAILLAFLAAGCASNSDMSYRERPAYDTGLTVKEREAVPPLDPKRKISEQDCSRPVEVAGGNLMCKGEPTAAERAAERRRLEEEERQRKLAAERRARLEEQERLARAQREADERAARERAERERAEQLAREEAARKAKLAEDERLAAEAKAREARELQERQEAEARARARAEQEAREAAERERQRLEQEWLAGRALLEKFVANYGKMDKFKDVAEPINGFLDKTR